ncbi:hypothetical protein ACFM35_00870 [Microbacterium sp. P01]|uniref:hypothetical protein n=1 Tax=Microbacterium sp. P01 TaxID=3366261 RepID=UPI00366F6D97
MTSGVPTELTEWLWRSIVEPLPRVIYDTAVPVDAVCYIPAQHWGDQLSRIIRHPDSPLSPEDEADIIAELRRADEVHRGPR